MSTSTAMTPSPFPAPPPAKVPWQERAATKQAALHAALPEDCKLDPTYARPHPSEHGQDVRCIPLTCGLLSGKELEITGTKSVRVLLDKLARGEWTSEEVARAFIRRAAVAQQVVNCLTEPFFQRGIARAKELDAHLEKTGKLVGPLHGLPISLKDHFPVKGTEYAGTWVSGLGNFSTDDALIAQTLERQGTSVPQNGRMFVKADFNNLYGPTLNPYNTHLVPGGSGSGDAALIAMGGAIVGMGVDNGGSVRCPAAYQGLYGFKASCNRLPYIGMDDLCHHIKVAIGFMSCSVDALRLCVEAVLHTRPWLADPTCLRMPWSDASYQLSDHGQGKDLTFAIMWDDGVATPDPPYRRALEITKTALVQAGHRVIDWVPYKSAESYELGRRIYNTAGSHHIPEEAAKTGEPILFFPPDLNPDRVFPALSSDEITQLGEERKELMKGHLDHWNATATQTGTGRPVDAIITPTVVAVPFEAGKMAYQGYTEFCNMHDYAAAVFPVTTVDKDVDVKLEKASFMSDWDRFTHENYDAAMSHGMPVGLQLVGRRHEEEAVLRMTEIAVEALGA